jgi:hypothetical protein
MHSTQIGTASQPAHLDHLADYLQATEEDRRVSPGVIALVAALIVLPLALLLIPPAIG